MSTNLKIWLQRIIIFGIIIAIGLISKVVFAETVDEAIDGVWAQKQTTAAGVCFIISYENALRVEPRAFCINQRKELK